jgi:hypothetical protein
MSITIYWYVFNMLITIYRYVFNMLLTIFQKCVQYATHNLLKCIKHASHNLLKWVEYALYYQLIYVHNVLNKPCSSRRNMFLTISWNVLIEHIEHCSICSSPPLKCVQLFSMLFTICWFMFTMYSMNLVRGSRWSSLRKYAPHNLHHLRLVNLSLREINLEAIFLIRGVVRMVLVEEMMPN